MHASVPVWDDQEWNTFTQESDYNEEGFGSLSTAAGHLPLQAMDVKGKIAGLFAHISLEQTFVNVYEQPMEATYIFPLPPDAAVTSFQMEVAGRLVRGVLQERGAARETYQRAISQGKRAAIAEEDRADVFSMQVGNILPSEQARVRLTLSFPLLCRDGEVTFRFPLVVAPRYIPGKPLGDCVGDGMAPDTDVTPDASRISPPVLLKGYPNPVRLGLTVELSDADVEASSLKASLHALLVGQDKGGLFVSLAPNERLNRDFILRFKKGREEVMPTLWLAPDATNRPHWEQAESGIPKVVIQKDQGTMLLTVTPPQIKTRRKARDVIFVLDRSGSMSGWKMVAARRATMQMLESLQNRDRFQVLAFDHHMEAPPGFDLQTMIHAKRCNQQKAFDYLSKLDARGGTEMAAPLITAAKALNADTESRKRDRVLVLVTDGQVGNEDQIIRQMGEHLGDARVFTLGIDTAVNAGFLQKLASQGRGLCELVESESRMEEAFTRIQRIIETPVLSELKLSLEGVEMIDGTMCPKRLPDLFEGIPLNVMARYKGNHEGALLLEARDAAGNKWSHRIGGEIIHNPSIPSLWARHHIRECEDAIAAGKHQRNYEDDILQTSLSFSVLSRFTAFVAVDEEIAVKDQAPLHQVVQPVEQPDGWVMAEGGEATPPLALKKKIPARKKSKQKEDKRVVEKAKQEAFSPTETNAFSGELNDAKGAIVIGMIGGSAAEQGGGGMRAFGAGAGSGAGSGPGAAFGGFGGVDDEPDTSEMFAGDAAPMFQSFDLGIDDDDMEEEESVMSLGRSESSRSDAPVPVSDVLAPGGPALPEPAPEMPAPEPVSGQAPPLAKRSPAMPPAPPARPRPAPLRDTEKLSDELAPEPVVLGTSLGGRSAGKGSGVDTRNTRSRGASMPSRTGRLKKEKEQVEDLREQAAADWKKKPAEEAQRSLSLEKQEERQRVEEAIATAQEVELHNRSWEQWVLDLFTVVLVKLHKAIPLSVEDGVLLVAMVNPKDKAAIKALEAHTGYTIRPLKTSLESFEAARSKCYGEG